MCALTRVRLRLYLRILGVSAIIGMVYAFVVTASAARASVMAVLVTALIGAIDGTIIGSSSAFDFFVLRWLRTRWLDAQPLIALIALRIVVYGGMAAAVSIGQPGEHLFGVAAPFSAHKAAVTIGFSLAVSTVLMVLFEAAALVGHRTFLALLLGKYRQPSAERRFFLFVDVVGSTPVAERMGPLAVHRYLDRVFQVASDPVDAHHGEVHQYVGDEMVVTWNVAEGRLEARPLACLFAIEAALAAAAPEFDREFGTVPKIRAALHAGEVVTGEIGGSRRAIVFHGDVMNTTSRIENATRTLGRNFLVSEDALSRLENSGRYVPEDLGPQQLRGREAMVRVYAVHAA